MLAVYTVILASTGIRADLAESNLQANLIRASLFLNEAPTPVALAGSSVAGRLLPEFFAEGGTRVQNLGLDGSRPLFAFEIIRLRKELPEVILVDTSTLFQPLMENDNTLREALNTPGWQLATRFLPMRPESRPSSITYSALKEFRDRKVSGHALPPYEEARPQAGPQRRPTWRPEDQYAAVRNALVDFQNRHARILFVRIPSGAGWGIPRDGLDRTLADDLGLPFLEPGVELARDGVVLRFPDGIHLDSTSADAVASVVARQLSAKNPEP